MLEEEEKIDEDSKNEKIIEQNYDIGLEKNILNINNNIKQRNKYKNISNDKFEKINNNNCCEKKNIKKTLKIIFCPCYCLFYKTFEWIWDGRCKFETYYKSNYFFENIFFSILSIFDIIANSFYKEDLHTSFFIIRIISDFFGILIFWLSIVLWEEKSSKENNFKTGFLLFTIIELLLMSLLDIFSFIAFCSSNSDFNIIVLMSFLIHLILSIAIFSFNLCKFLNSCN